MRLRLTDALRTRLGIERRARDARRSRARINRDRNLRMQYLAGFGLNLDDSAAIYAGMLAYQRFPEDMIAGAPERVKYVREAIQRAP